MSWTGRRAVSGVAVLRWAIVLGLLLVAVTADARVGGGQTFSSGGGGYSGGGGGGGMDGELLLFVLELAIRYPRVGVPMLGILVVFVVGRHLLGERVQRKVFGRKGRALDSPLRSAQREVPGLAQLRRDDPAFSATALTEFVVLLHRRVIEAAQTGVWGPISHLVQASVQAKLRRQSHPVSEVVVGSVDMVSVQRQSQFTVVTVQCTSTRLLGGPQPQRMLTTEVWSLRRRRDCASLPPEDLTRLGCPACGVSIETTTMGACPNCDTAITSGQLNWELFQVQVVSQKPVQPPETKQLVKGEEDSVHYPSVLQSGLGAHLRSFQARHPDFSMEDFGVRVQGIYLGLQDAWSRGRWGEVRPWVTDSLYQSLRFWIEAYTAHGLRNELRDVRLNRMQVVRVAPDAWYETVTVRIWGQMKDTVVDRKGKVVGGDATRDRVFSEYWTFIRSSGSGGHASAPDRCPSCSGPLDQVSQAGECGYCGSIITSGTFDWVLSRIDQAATYTPPL